MACTAKPLLVPCRARLIHAAPASKLCVEEGLPVFSSTFSEATSISTEAWFAHFWLLGVSKSRNAGKYGLVRRAYRKRQGWLLVSDGAQRAASNKVINSSWGMSSPDKARGDQRSRNW